MSTLTIAQGGVADLRRSRQATARRLVGVLSLPVLGLCVLQALVGASYVISAPDFLRILLGADIPGASYIALELRLPRLLLGLLVGAALGTSGAIFQSVLKNPLASPDVIGVAQGASLAAVAAMVILGWSGATVGLAALMGAFGATSLVLILGRGGAAGPRVILVGVALAAGLLAITQYLVTRTTVTTAQEALLWMSGSLNPADWTRVRFAALTLTVQAGLVILVRGRLRILELGDDLATSLGLRPRATRLILLMLGAGLAAVATSVAGPVAFVAFVCAPIVRRLPGGQDNLVAAALFGAALVLAADWVGANALPVTLPVGVITGAAGAPMLVWLLIRHGGRP